MSAVFWMGLKFGTSKHGTEGRVNDMRLGDLDALWEYFRDLQCDITKYSRYHQLNDEDKAAYDKLDAVLERIDDAPTIDAVPVVRCRHCERQQMCQLAQRLGVNGFCSEGERKGGDGNDS